MKLIIDIDKATYEYAKNNKSYLPLFYCEEVWRALSEGTPIPDNAKQDEAISTLKNTAWLGTEDDRAKVDEAISALERQSDIEAIRDGNDPTVSNFQNILNSQINNSMKGDTE